jgi:Raf kinase inhibitor-like YbhB/YbcL family protein
MKISSSGIKDNYLNDAYGHRGTQFLNSKKSNRSFPVQWQDVPENTVTLAFIFIDYDAIPVCGFPWIHWTVANIDPALGGLPENASVEQNLLEGVCSWSSKMVPPEWQLDFEDAIGFGGCAPPDQQHRYTLDVYALDTSLDLRRGFYMNELIKAMEGHVLAQVSLHAWYKTKESL